MKTEVTGGRLHASVDAFGLDERFENNLSSRLSIVGPEPGGQTTVVDFKQTAPGRYEVDHPIDKYGSFLLRAEHMRQMDNGELKQVAVSFGHVSNPYPKEYAGFEPDITSMQKAAVATGGAMDPANVQVIFDAAGEKVTYHEELWPRFIYAAIAVFLLDLFVRRVRLFDRKFLPRKSSQQPAGRPFRVSSSS